MNTITKFAAMAVGLGLTAGFVRWRVQFARSKPNIQIEIVKDLSKSTTEGCESLAGLAEIAFTTSGVSAKSVLTVLITGDATTANEPRVLASFPIPVSTRVVEDRNASTRRQQRLARDLVVKCETIPPTNTSPIFLAVKQGLADLRGRGCATNSHCRLLVDSDLEENVEPWMKSRLAGIALKKPMPNILDNSNIAVTLCGIAATRRISDGPDHDDRIQTTWREVFSSKDLVSFQPYCLAPRDSADYRSAEVSSASPRGGPKRGAVSLSASLPSTAF